MLKIEKTFIKEIKSIIKAYENSNKLHDNCNSNPFNILSNESSKNEINIKQNDQQNNVNSFQLSANVLEQLEKDIAKSNNLNYISLVKYTIFFISKIAFIRKLYGNEILNEDYYSFLSNNVLNCKEMGIFKSYNSFDLNIISLEKKLYDLIYLSKDDIHHESFLPAILYENLLTPEDKKSLGQVYTPIEIVHKMIEQAFSLKTIDCKTKFLDPCCGGGYFIIELFKKLRSINSISININNRDIFDLNSTSIHTKEKFIIENMIFGVDVDEFSIFLTKLGLLLNTSLTDINFNIFKIDFLTEDIKDVEVTEDIEDFKSEFIKTKSNPKQNFDFIIGNPPYIGSKHMDMSYKLLLKESYSEVFYDKSDISYCFFKKSKEILKKDGVISFITSRYFLEAMYADKLRSFLKNNFNIISIIDYSGLRVFKGAMVSPAVITLSNSKLIDDFNYVKYNDIQNKADQFTFNQNKLKNDGWIILNNEVEAIFNRIENISNTYIKDVTNIKQGIITGMDKAFVVTEKEVSQYDIESFLLRKWIKNSNIAKDKIKYNNLYLIYTNLIKHESECPNAISYLLPFKESLMNRRECRNGLRKWYELQWGRNKCDFENPKIVFPYKSSTNNFFYDTNKYFCSADIYIINELNSSITYDYLQNYLNSSIFEFYFKCQAKKVGVGMFEYYPNKINLMKIYLPTIKTQQKLSLLGNFSIEYFLKKVFNINEEENEIINKFIFRKGDDAD